MHIILQPRTVCLDIKKTYQLLWKQSNLLINEPVSKFPELSLNSISQEEAKVQAAGASEPGRSSGSWTNERLLFTRPCTFQRSKTVFRIPQTCEEKNNMKNNFPPRLSSYQNGKWKIWNPKYFSNFIHLSSFPTCRWPFRFYIVISSFSILALTIHHSTNFQTSDVICSYHDCRVSLPLTAVSNEIVQYILPKKEWCVSKRSCAWMLMHHSLAA